MNRLFLFNPENDIALASGKACFTPPKNAAELHRCGAMLLWWLGSDGDAVVVNETDYDSCVLFAKEMSQRFDEGPAVTRFIAEESVPKYVPWGWSANALRQFQNIGGQFTQADFQRMERLRILSHRRSSIVLNSALADSRIGDFPPIPCEIRDRAALAGLLEKWGEVYVKAPWSSTGRGVVCSSEMSFDELWRRTEGTIRRQGSVLVEKAMNKVVDFAMLFRSEAGVVDFAGYSLFFNGHGSAYGGNLLLTDNEIESRLAGYLGTGLLNDVASVLRAELTDLVATDYSGNFGVDMMICDDGRGGYQLAPCVELNLRLTMGVVAHRLVERFGTEIPYKKLMVAPANAATENALWLVPKNESYFIGLV